MSEPRRVTPPQPTQAQLDDLYDRLTPLRMRYPGWSDSQIAATTEASRLIFEWRKEHRLLPQQQPRY
jgi:hypothetical protein